MKESGTSFVLLYTGYSFIYADLYTSNLVSDADPKIMHTIIPVTDLQRQAAQILRDVNASREPVIITQRGRASAVIISATRYAEIEEDLATLDDLELVQMLEQSKRDRESGNTLTHDEVKKRLGYPE